MSLSYSIVSGIIRLSHIKKIFTKDRATILKYANMQNNMNKFNFEKIKKKAKYSKCKLLDFSGYPCVVYYKNNFSSNNATLLLYGGGMITGPDKMDYSLADRLANETGRDVYFPMYPLCIDNSIAKTYSVSHQVYQTMLETYGAKHINVLGFSSGATLAIGIFLYNNELKNPLAPADKIIAVSPGGLPDLESDEDKKIMAELEELSKKDILVDAKYFKTAREILKHNEDVPEYMLNSLKGNFNNFPKTHFYYGESESLYAYAPYFCKELQKYNVPYKLTVGKGMCHCYPLPRLFKEGREAQDQIIEQLK